jgi:hypothetical protein
MTTLQQTYRRNRRTTIMWVIPAVVLWAIPTALATVGLVEVLGG